MMLALLQKKPLPLLSKTEEPQLWIEATRIYFQCCVELEEASAVHATMEEVLNLLSLDVLDESLQAQAETL